MVFTTLGSSKYDYRPYLVQLDQRIASLQKIILLYDTSGIYSPEEFSPFFDCFGSLFELGRGQKRDRKSQEDSLADTDIPNLQFTSGSTGSPKAAALTHHGMINCARYIYWNDNEHRERG